MEQPAQTPPDAPMNNANTMPDKSGGSKGWMAVAVIAILALIGMGIFGYFKWQQYRTLTGNLGAEINNLKNQAAELEAEVTTLSAKTPTTSSDKDMILAAIKAFCATEPTDGIGPELAGTPSINVSQTNFAEVNFACKGHPEGLVAVLAKTSGSWNIVAVGGGTGPFSINPEVRKIYRIPSTLPTPFNPGTPQN